MADIFLHFSAKYEVHLKNNLLHFHNEIMRENGEKARKNASAQCDFPHYFFTVFNVENR